jgi:hypothetical protein
VWLHVFFQEETMNSAILKRLNDKTRHMFSEFGDDLTKIMAECCVHEEHRSKIKCFVMNYQFGQFCEDDLKKRKRNTHVVVTSDRCIAKRSTGEQCTRRHKEGSQYCGTHNKGQPHGKVDESVVNSDTKKEVRAEEIKGIVYYIDDDGNVYDTEQVHQNIDNPSVVGKYLNGVLTKYNV